MGFRGIGGFGFALGAWVCRFRGLGLQGFTGQWFRVSKVECLLAGELASPEA